MSKEKRIFEPDNVEEALRGWLLHTHKGRDRNDEAARQLDKYRYWFGGLTLGLSAVVGTSIFISLTQEEAPLFFKILAGLLSMAASVFASLQTFLKYPERVENHRAIGAKYKAIIRELEQIFTEGTGNLGFDRLNDLRNRLDTLEKEEAPIIPNGIYQRIERKYSNPKFVGKVIQ